MQQMQVMLHLQDCRITWLPESAHSAHLRLFATPSLPLQWTRQNVSLGRLPFISTHICSPAFSLKAMDTAPVDMRARVASVRGCRSSCRNRKILPSLRTPSSTEGQHRNASILECERRQTRSTRNCWHQSEMLCIALT